MTEILIKIAEFIFDIILCQLRGFALGVISVPVRGRYRSIGAENILRIFLLINSSRDNCVFCAQKYNVMYTTGQLTPSIPSHNLRIFLSQLSAYIFRCF